MVNPKEMNELPIIVASDDEDIEDVRRIQEAIDDAEEYVRKLTEWRDSIVFRLNERGEPMTASDGTRFSVKENRRREVVPELVKMKYPSLYDRIYKSQKDSFEPKITLGVLSDLDDDALSGVVVTKMGLPRVEVKRTKVEKDD